MKDGRPETPEEWKAMHSGEDGDLFECPIYHVKMRRSVCQERQDNKRHQLADGTPRAEFASCIGCIRFRRRPIKEDAGKGLGHQFSDKGYAVHLADAERRRSNMAKLGKQEKTEKVSSLTDV